MDITSVYFYTSMSFICGIFSEDNQSIFAVFHLCNGIQPTTEVCITLHKSHISSCEMESVINYVKFIM